ncbi:carboxyl transferase domain-containing protein [Paucibacter sp. R3-3]|uniref:Carboxyl transferase domain-containing protein n=1 Tax=Roseateles agri TaxID=3098619 RepID=A0ABU5DA95_9BURK|nr:carboxyl transferase domain-containing protein [Paucibacter sp. R3-3]MDY0743198.1 carboxyl transferase domain-containing protein [Paucibacter sp. R3-3]
MKAPMSAQLVQIVVQPGQALRRGEPLLVLEAMKMEHELVAPADGVVAELLFAAGESVREGEVLLRLRPGAALEPGPAAAVLQQAEAERVELAAWRARQALTLDTARPEAIAKRHALGLRSARENVEDLCDPGSFVEYGALAFAAQTRRRDADELRAQTPADGMVCGIGRVGGSETVVLAYDATVLAGTQGFRNHQKTDRMLEIALRRRLPVVLFAEGGGGRPGDTDMPIVAGLHVPTFASFARLAGQVPLVGIAAGRCFAGNAALLACCDLIVATRGSNIGMGGPAMVEGGGLGVYPPEAIGPAEVQAGNGVVDLLVEDEAAAVRAVQQFLGMKVTVAGWQAADQPPLRDAIPANRLRAYEIRPLVARLVDEGSLLELRTAWGAAVLTFLARIEGRPVALLASNCAVNGGAIDAAAATKAADWMARCEAMGLPLVSLVDTPGFMVGPEAEALGQVRASGGLFRAAARMTQPIVAVVLRRAYGLGAMALAGGSLHAPLASLAWPGAEFGAMGLEGAVRLGYRKELAALPEGPQRQALFDQLLARQVDDGRAVRMAEMLEIDAVIDPADTRAVLARLLAA